MFGLLFYTYTRGYTKRALYSKNRAILIQMFDSTDNSYSWLAFAHPILDIRSQDPYISPNRPISQGKSPAERALYDTLPSSLIIFCTPYMRHWRSKEPYTAQEASCWRVFDPVSRLLFALYHWLRNKDLSRFVPLTREPGSICASFQWMGSTPARFQKACRAALAKKSPILSFKSPMSEGRSTAERALYDTVSKSLITTCTPYMRN